jgi:hypothetical protein
VALQQLMCCTPYQECGSCSSFETLSDHLACYTRMKSTVVWFVTPCTANNVRFVGGTYHHLQDWRVIETSRALLVTWFTLISCLPYSWTLKMEATCSSETSVDFYRSTRRYNPGDTLHDHLKSYIFMFNLVTPYSVNLCDHLPYNLAI